VQLYCQQCQAPWVANAQVCGKCGWSPAGPIMATTVQKNLGDDAGIRMLLPVGRSGWAIAAGYLGLFSIMPCFGIVAVIVGLVAVRDIRKHPEKHGLGRAYFGVIVGALSMVGWIALVVVGNLTSGR